MDRCVTCVLCDPPSLDALIFRSLDYRIVWAQDADYPCFVRVVWQAHVVEMTDLSAAQQGRLMTVVFAVEAAMRSVLRPHKINLASFGNRTPHVHWHVIPRWADDAHWPEPNWVTPQRAGAAHGTDLRSELAAQIVCSMQALA